MKQIFTFLFCVGAFTTSFAQYHSGNRDNNNYSYNQNNHFGGNFSPKDREFQIEKINRDFNFKIESIEKNWSLRHHQKKVAIRNLEKERARQIQIVNARFSHWKSDYDNHWYSR